MNQTQILTLLILLGLSSVTLASGSAPYRPPRPPKAAAPGQTENIDDARYALGKAVFNGKAPLQSNPRAARQQEKRLNQLAAETGSRGASLPNLAGKLSAEQLDALEYYVSKRYGAH